MIMKNYEKPKMEVIRINDHVLTYSCEGTYPCDSEGPGFCVVGYEPGTIVEE